MFQEYIFVIVNEFTKDLRREIKNEHDSPTSHFLLLQVTSEVFPQTSGGGEALSNEFQIPFLGRLPIDPNLARTCDEGSNFITGFPSSPTTQFMMNLTSKLL